eukprot:s1184_g4.t1
MEREEQKSKTRHEAQKPYGFQVHIFYVIVVAGLSFISERLMATSRRVFALEICALFLCHVLCFYIACQDGSLADSEKLNFHCFNTCVLIAYAAQLVTVAIAQFRFAANAQNLDPTRGVFADDTSNEYSMAPELVSAIRSEGTMKSMKRQRTQHSQNDVLNQRWQHLSFVRVYVRKFCIFAGWAVIAVWLGAVIVQSGRVIAGIRRTMELKDPLKPRRLDFADGADADAVTVAVEMDGNRQLLRDLKTKTVSQLLEDVQPLTFWQRLQGKRLAVRDEEGVELSEDSSEVVSMMLSADGGSALLSQTNRQGQSALHIAATAGASNSLRLLVAEGADTDAKDAHGKTALQYAEQRGDVEAVESISMGSTLKAAEDSGGKAQNFKSSASWTAQDEAAVGAELEEGLSTELIAAVIVAVAGGGLCLVLLVCMLRRRFGRRKRSMVAQEAKPERRKQVWTEQTEALRKNRTLNNEDRRESNEVHQLQGSALKAAVVVHTPATPTQARSAGEVSQLAFQAEAPKVRSDPKKGKLSQGPRQAAKADSPSQPTAQDHRRKAKAKSRSAKQPK